MTDPYYSTNDTMSVSTGPEADKQFLLPKQDAQLISWCDKRLRQGRAIMPVNQQKLNMAFYLGFQWVTWDHRMRAYRRPTVDIQDPNTPVRLSANKVGQHTRSRIARLTKNVPEPECRPVSNTDQDISGARVGSRILEHELDRLNWNTWLQRFMQWPEVVGWGYAHPWWNPKLGSKIGSLPAQKRGDPDDELFLGDISLDIVAPFELSVDPSCINPDLSDALWACRVNTLTTEAVWDRWGVAVNGGAARSLSMEVHALGSVGQAEPAAQAESWVNVYQMWVRPCRAAPKGAVITWTGNTVIDKQFEYPYEHGQLPFVQLNQLPGLGVREGMSVVTDMIPLQTDYNDNLSREATIRRQLTPKLVHAIGQVDPQRLTSRVESLPYTPGVAPTPPELVMPNAGWAQQFELGMNRDEADMQAIAGLNDAASGKSASSAAAATTGMLQETADTNLSISATELASFIERVGWQILMLARQYWTEERTIRVWSDDNVLEAFRYIGSDIDERLDVHVSSEAALPRSKAGRAQMIFELQARFPGLIDPKTVIDMLELPGTDVLTRALDTDTRKQYREIAQLLLGQNPQVRPYDNHQIHLKVLNNFRQSIDYENLPVEMQAHIDAHAAIHESLFLRQMGIQVPEPQATMDPQALAQAQMVKAGPAGPSSGQNSLGGGAATAPGAGGQNGPPPGVAPPAGSGMSGMAAIGGPGNPGSVPNMGLDQEAHLLGR